MIALWDVGAYCGILGSHYNMRPRRMELLVTGKNVKIIRKEEIYEDIILEDIRSKKLFARWHPRATSKEASI